MDSQILHFSLLLLLQQQKKQKIRKPGLTSGCKTKLCSPDSSFVSATPQHFNCLKIGQQVMVCWATAPPLRPDSVLAHRVKKVTHLTEQAQTNIPTCPAALWAVSSHTRSEPCHCSPQTHVNIPTRSKLQPISKLLPMPILTRRGVGQQPPLNMGDKPQLLPNKTIVYFKSLSPVETDAHFLPLTPAGSQETVQPAHLIP